MTSRILSIAGSLARSPYPERDDKSTSAPDLWARAVVDRLWGVWRTPVARELRHLMRLMTAQRAALAAASDAQLRQQLRQHAALAVHELRRADMHQALLNVAEIAYRTLAMRPYATQLLGDSQARSSLAAAARRRAECMFDSQRAAEMLIKLYQSSRP